MIIIAYMQYNTQLQLHNYYYCIYAMPASANVSNAIVVCVTSSLALFVKYTYIKCNRLVEEQWSMLSSVVRIFSLIYL